MNHSRVLYHMVRADFLERVRRYSFLLTLAFAVYLGYAVYTGQIVWQFAEYRGVYNSAWLGCLVTLVSTAFLTLVGFYVVKNTIQRDRETRVGQILATTPMSKAFYTLAKTLSNFVVLATMVLIMALAALLMQLMRAEDRHIHLWALLGPLLVFALSALAVTAALAVLFETIPGLRGGLGNVIYFFVWSALLALGVSTLGNSTLLTTRQYLLDYSGVGSVVTQVQAQLRQIDPQYKGGSALTVAGGMGPISKQFLWSGLEWKRAIFLARAMWLAIAGAIALLAALFFNRFDPSRTRLRGKQKVAPASKTLDDSDQTAATLPPLRHSPAHLDPLGQARTRTRFAGTVMAELRLMLKGHAWWWYIVAAGLFIACLSAPLYAVRAGIIVAAWVWPSLLWSQMGSRESRHATQSLLFSSAHALQRQLPAAWIAGFVLALATGGGLGLRLLITGDEAGFAAWIAGAAFIPSLALALGVWSNSGKPFEALYTIWWYIGPAHHAPGLDFMGTTPGSSTPAIYLIASAVLMAAAYAGRRARLAYA